MSPLNRLSTTPFSVLVLVTFLIKVGQSSDSCTCVHIDLCADIGINRDEAVEIEIHPRSGLSNGQCSHYLEVCCDNVQDSPKIPNDGRRCGFRNEPVMIFAIDHEASYSEFPWMVAILKSGSNNSIVGGGSLIHPKVVLTAAHVVHKENKQNLVIRGGEWDLETTAEIYPSQDSPVSKIIMHDQYKKRYEINNNRIVSYNEVALIILAKPFILSNFVNTVCLPTQNFEFDSSRCFSSGWGKYKYAEDGYYQGILKKVELPIVQRGSCLDLLQETRLPIESLHESFICAGGVIGKDTCTGDVGGPLVCPFGNEYGRNGRYQQAGIVAWRIKCASKTPAVYVNVALFRDWIDDQMANENLETSYYTS